MSKVRRGHDFEREIVKQFKALGYSAIRSAASNGEWDVILVKKSNKQKRIIGVAFCQCKITYNMNANPESVLKN